MSTATGLTGQNNAPFSNSSGVKIVFKKLRFRDGLVSTATGLTGQNKAPFSNSSGVKIVFKKLRFRDGLVSKATGLTGQNKALFSNSSGLVWTKIYHFSLLIYHTRREVIVSILSGT